MIWHGERESEWYPQHTSLWYKCAECNQRCQFRLRLLTINSWWIFTSFLFLSGRSLLCHVMFTHVLCFNSVKNFFSFALSNLSLSKFYVLKWISDRGRHNNLLWRKQLHWMLRESEVDWCICSLLTSDYKFFWIINHQLLHDFCWQLSSPHHNYLWNHRKHLINHRYAVRRIKWKKIFFKIFSFEENETNSEANISWKIYNILGDALIYSPDTESRKMSSQNWLLFHSVVPVLARRPSNM